MSQGRVGVPQSEGTEFVAQPLRLMFFYFRFYSSATKYCTANSLHSTAVVIRRFIIEAASNFGCLMTSYRYENARCLQRRWSESVCTSCLSYARWIEQDKG
jgi:hypothetical protein